MTIPPISVTPIGVVRSPMTEPVDEGWGDVVAEIHLEPALAGGLLGLTDFSHVMVVTWLHQADFDLSRHIQRHPRGRKDLPLVGIFAQRAKDRPNPMGVTVVPIISVSGNVLTVRGLDAIDGTPVLDLKPHFPIYDQTAEAHLPDWVGVIMEGYFN